MLKTLKNKKIIISAGASGIGWATAKICLSRGAFVYICDLDLKALNKIKKVGIQGPGNLGTKMKRQFLKTHHEQNLSHQIRNPILIIGSDLPSISHFELIQAIQTLKHKEMVLGPSSDGGYWLIGLSKKLLNPLCTWPFSGINWGSNKVLQETIRLASLNQIDYQLLQTKNDLDNIID